MNGPTREELHSPDETPVLGAMVDGCMKRRTNNRMNNFGITTCFSMFTENTLVTIRTCFEMNSPLKNAINNCS